MSSYQLFCFVSPCLKPSSLFIFLFSWRPCKGFGSGILAAFFAVTEKKLWATAPCGRYKKSSFSYFLFIIEGLLAVNFLMQHLPVCIEREHTISVLHRLIIQFAWKQLSNSSSKF